VQSSALRGDAVRAFSEMYRGGNMPACLRAGAADPLLLRHHLVLHDAEAPWAQAEAVRAAVAATFGATSVTALLLNSRAAEEAAAAAERRPPPPPPPAEAWAAARAARRGAAAPAAAPAAALGCELSASDCARVASFVADFTAAQLIPFLESKVVSLSAAIAGSRKGLRNTLKSLWRPKESGRQEGLPGDAYPHGSAEAQARLCGDLSLMLRDYELAAGHLRLAAADFRADRALPQLAAAQEALGCALAAADAPRREVEAAFEAAAAAARARGGGGGARQLLRAALLHAAALAEGGGGAGPLARCAAEQPHTTAAPLLEASALCLLAARPPLSRRAALHCLLAAQRYAQAGLGGGCARQLAAARALLARAGHWRRAELACCARLAALRLEAGGAGALEALTAAARAAAAAPPSGGSDAPQHSAWLDGLARAAGGATLSALPLPEADMRSVRVAAEDHRGFGDPAARGVPEEVWAALEADARAGPPLVPPELAAAAAAAAAGLAQGNWLDGGAARAAAAAQPQTAACVAGEPVLVRLALRNPLGCALRLRRLRLAAEAEGGCECEEREMTLAPGERASVALRCTPRAPGALRLTGLAWELVAPGGGAVAAAQRLQLPAPLRRRVAGAWLPDAPPSRRLQLRVGPPAPRLEGSLEGLPARAAAGQLLRLALCLRNVGAAPLHRLRLACSFPGLRLGRAPLRAGEAAGEWGWEAACEEPQQAAQAACDLPAPHARLEPGATLRWPLWLHCGDAGALEAARLVVFYAPEEAAEAAPPMRFRLLRIAFSLPLSPLLLASCTQAAADGGGRLLRLQAADAQPEGRPRLRLLAALPQPPLPLRPLSAAAQQAVAVPGDGSAAQLFLACAGDGGGGLSFGAPAEAPTQAAGALAALLAAGCADGQPRLALLWQAAGGDGEPPLRGMSLLRLQAAGAAAAPGLSAALSGPNALRADFRRAAAELRLTLTLRNGGAAPVASPRLQLLPPEGGGCWEGPDAAALPSAPRFAWLGAVERRLAPLAPGEARALQLRLLLLAPGVHNLQAWWRLSWEGGAQSHNAPFLVLAEQGDAPAEE